jgi:hypothetical protein
VYEGLGGGCWPSPDPLIVTVGLAESPVNTTDDTGPAPATWPGNNEVEVVEVDAVEVDEEVDAGLVVSEEALFLDDDLLPPHPPAASDKRTAARTAPRFANTERQDTCVSAGRPRPHQAAGWSPR